jgi:hypothetical protein
MQKTLDSFSTLLTMITSSFLLDEMARPHDDVLQKATASHQASFTSLKKSLGEARSEAIFGGPSSLDRTGGRESFGQAYEDAVDSLTRLGQHLNGLRGGTRLQMELTKAHLEGKIDLHRRESMAGNLNMENGKSRGTGLGAGLEGEERFLFQAAADMFGELVDDLGPPLRALSVRLVSFGLHICTS